MPNALARSASPYLRQHADNPVDWLPWGEEAFARARAENKPIFLSIGYATCHWCHVMAHESFESPEIAAQLNRDFISIKVDREERPDVDRVYMSYVQALTGHGGWPLSVFLTPELRPIYGGTYFAPEDRQGRMGFPTVLGTLTAAWTERRDEILAEGRRIATLLSAPRTGTAGGTDGTGAASEPPPSAQGDAMALLAASWSAAWSALSSAFDATNGGFGSAPKFPQPALLAFVLRLGLAGDDEATRTRALGMVTHTLACMARGGVHDPVGGGFHRYSVDEAWFVPHFEKMLYDQAQLASLCLAAHQASGDARLAWLARDILGYCLRDLRAPSGAFFAAEDADSPVDRAPGATRREGAFYVWRLNELRELLDDADFALAVSMFSLRDGGNVPQELDPHGELTDRNILHQAAPLAELARSSGLAPAELAAARSRILGILAPARGRRPRPLRDEKIIAAWNGLLLSSLARASLCSAPAFAETWESGPVPSGAGENGGAADTPAGGRDVCLAAARRCASALRELLWDPALSRLRRSWCDGTPGPLAVSADYACVIQGLLDLYEAGLEECWLGFALELQARLDALFWDEATGGYFDASCEASDLFVRLRDDHDGAEPAAAGIAALNLLRLSALCGREDFRLRALRVLDGLQPGLLAAPQAHPCALLALEWAASWPPRRQVLAAAPGDPRLRAAALALSREPGPPTVLLAVGPDGYGRALLQGQPWLAEIAARSKAGEILLYTCGDGACSAPVPPPL